MQKEDLDRNITIRLASSAQKKTICDAMDFYTGMLHGEFERILPLICGEYKDCHNKLARFRNGWTVIEQVLQMLYRVYLGDGIISFLKPGKSVVVVHNFTEDVKFMKGLLIKCTVRESLIIRDALNLYSRVLMGQVREIDWVIRAHHWDKVSKHDPQAVNIIMGILSADLFGFQTNASFGIANKDNCEKSKIAYELLRWIEYDLFKDDPDVQQGHSVLKHEPLRVTSQKRICLKFCDKTLS